MRYVATIEDEWVAVAGFGSAALCCPVRERFLGWDEQTRSRRLALVAGNQRLCVLPAGRFANLASAVLAACLRALPDDYEQRFGHPVLAVETFTDPSRHTGSCYAAAGFSAVGPTAGYGRIRGGRLVHGQPKTYWLRPLHRRGLDALTGCFDSPLAQAVTVRPAIDLNSVDIDGEGGLLDTLAQLVDYRFARGVRHDLAALLAVAVAARLCGAHGYASIASYAAELPQPALARLGIRYRRRFCLIPPSYHTLRRTIRAVDTDQLDGVVTAWLWRQVDTGAVPAAALRRLEARIGAAGPLSTDGPPLGLFAPIVHARPPTRPSTAPATGATPASASPEPVRSGPGGRG